MKKLFVVAGMIAVSVLFGPGSSEAADSWTVNGPAKAAKVAVSLTYNSPAGTKTVNYKPTGFEMRIERKPDLDDGYFPLIYTNVKFNAGNASLNASMTGSGIKTVATTLVNATVNNELENNNDADYPAFEFKDTTTDGMELSMTSDAMLTSTAEGSFMERGDIIDVSMKYTVMGTVTLNSLDSYPAKIIISVTAKGVGGV